MGLKQVVTISDDELSRLSRALVDEMAGSGFAPQVLVGIETGGARMVDALPEDLDVRRLTCRMQRPSTARKEATPGWRAAVNRMPYAVTNLLRVLEDRWHERRGAGQVPEPSETLLAEIAEVASVVAAGGYQRVAVVDDAVDSGATLACVMTALRAALPESVEVRSAVLTSTREPRLTAMAPDYRLYDLTLLRFPWSMDYKGPA